MTPKIPDFKQLTPSQSIIALAILALLVGGGILVFFNLRPNSASESAKLTVWGIENSDAFQTSFDKFTGLHSGVDIRYRQIPEANYEDTVINALAAGTGPDIFMFKNSWLVKNSQKILTAPADKIDILKFRDLYPQIAEQDFTDQNYIFALPLSIDTLSLFYNKNLFDQVGLIGVPKTWGQMQEAIEKLRIINAGGQIVRSGAALGGSDRTIKNATDILPCMMLQQASQDPKAVQNKTLFTSQAQTAANQYLQFGNPIQPFYTWNETRGNSLESFANEQTAMIVGYKNDLSVVKQKNPYLNSGVSALPQPDGAQNTVSCAKYWGLAISKQTVSSDWAWQLALFLTTDPDAAYTYASVTGKTPALRSLIATQLQDPQESVFAKQVLTARSWRNPNEETVRGIFNTFIINVLSGQVDFASAYSQAQSQITQLIRQ